MENLDFGRGNGRNFDHSTMMVILNFWPWSKIFDHMANIVNLNYARGPSIKAVRKNLLFFDPLPPRLGVSEITDHPLPPDVRISKFICYFNPNFRSIC